MDLERTRNGEISLKDEGKTLRVYGFAKRIRKLGGLTFIDLRDRSGIVQLVIKDEEVAKNIHHEYVL